MKNAKLLVFHFVLLSLCTTFALFKRNVMETKKKRIVMAGAGAALVLVIMAGVALYLLFAPFCGTKGNAYLYIDADDTVDSVYFKMESLPDNPRTSTARFCGALLSYGSHVHPGRYQLGKGIGTFQLMRHLRGGLQEPVRLTVPVVHTLADMAARLAPRLQADSAALYHAFTDAALLDSLGVDTATVPALFIPNTYEVFWTITPSSLLHRLYREYEVFWTAERKQKAEAAGLTPVEVSTLASIVEQESANSAERPAIAGMYLNRLRQGMKLQADPTVKFALGDFALRRILHAHLVADSPYNTYRNQGLPPGPICIPSPDAIDAVLNYQHHDYLYMCAKEDFSGTHNFAATYEEHLDNARRYAEALNRRGIK